MEQACPNCGKAYNPGDEVCPECGLVFPFTTDILAPSTILQSRYEIQELTHTGGMGYIYLAKDKKLYDRLCIVKQVKEPVKSDSDLKKLEEEARRMAKLSHPNVAMILDHFVEDDHYFLVVERISGETLSEAFEERHGQLTEEEVIGWAIAMCDVISYIHKQDIIHRDISPDNVMLTEEGNIKFVDFGTLRELRYITTKGTAGMGKYGYTPAEQWQGRPVPESDIFALGATIYYLLTGNLSLSKEYLSGQGPQKQDFSPDFPPIRQKNPEISPELEAVLQRACHLDVSNRYSSAAEFGRALGSLGRAAVPRRQIEEAVKPILSVDPERINFANVRVGSRATRSLTIRNIGTGRLTGKITTSHPWLKVTPETVDIERFKQDISVIVDARRLNKGVNIGGLIHINSSGGESNVDVSLSTDTLTRPTPAPVHEKPARKPLPVLTRRKIWLSAAAICVLALAVWGIITLVGISNPHLEIGKKVPDFTIPTLQGETVTLSDFRGKSVILYFWKSNCAPCVYEMPFLQAVFDKRPGEELAVLTISVGEPNETVRSFVEDKGFTFPVLLDANRKLSEKWGLVGVPTTFFIDAGGNLRGYKIGAFDNQGDLEEQLVSSLGISSPSPSTATKVIFEDDFSNPSSGWSTSSDNEVERRYESGGYRIVVKEADTLAWGGNKQIGSLGDFALEVDARCLSYNERSGVCGSYGIVFREQEGKNFYLFAISTGDLFTPGGYWIKKFVQGTSTALKAYAYSFKINKSRPTLTNRLKVVCRGEEFTVYVNGYELDTVTDYSFPKGDVGLAAWAGSEDEGEADVLFDNLKIYVPD